MAYTNVWHLGIDEAGLGPNLGPMVVASCMFVEHLPVGEPASDANWWDRLAPLVGKDVRKTPIVVNDSKQLFGGNLQQAKVPIQSLQAFLDVAARPLHERFTDSRTSMRGVQVEHHALPCLNADNTDKPIRSALSCQHATGTNFSLDFQHLIAACDERTELARTLNDLLLSRGLRFVGFDLDVVVPSDFNQRIDRLDNKSLVEQEIINRHFKGWLDHVRSQHRQMLEPSKTGVRKSSRAKPLCDEGELPSLFACVDRLGGRQYYGDFVKTLSGGLPIVVNESPAISSYRIGTPIQATHLAGVPITQSADSLFADQAEADDVVLVHEHRSLGFHADLHFEVGCDHRRFPVALASMLAKWARETWMEQFNQFWCEQVPGLEPTAGYPQDAKRFFDAISDAMKVRGISTDMMWRKR